MPARDDRFALRSDRANAHHVKYLSTNTRSHEMDVIHPKFLVDENNKRHAVVLSIEDWNQILEELEELDDIRAYDEAEALKEESIPLEQALREIEETE
jgi:hypothetical protein